MKKLMFASDIHGSAYWAQKTVTQFNFEKADYLVLLGDLLYHGPRNPLPQDYDPQGVAEVLNTIKDKIIAIRGNCDSEVDQLLLQFPMTAEYNILPFNGGKIIASHGHLYNEINLPKSLVAGDIFIYGHIHVPVLKQEKGVYMINPGSVSLPKEDHPNTYGVLEQHSFLIKTFDGATYHKLEL